MKKQKETLFKTKSGEEVSFEDLLSKIYENSVEKQKHMIETVNHVKPMIQTLQDAITLMPILTDLQKVSVTNDDALIKMAAIIQRGKKGNKDKGGEDIGFGLTEEDRKTLLEQAQKLKEVPGSSKG